MEKHNCKICGKDNTNLCGEDFVRDWCMECWEKALKESLNQRIIIK